MCSPSAHTCTKDCRVEDDKTTWQHIRGIDKRDAANAAAKRDEWGRTAGKWRVRDEMSDSSSSGERQVWGSKAGGPQWTLPGSHKLTSSIWSPSLKSWQLPEAPSWWSLLLLLSGFFSWDNKLTISVYPPLDCKQNLTLVYVSYFPVHISLKQDKCPWKTYGIHNAFFDLQIIFFFLPVLSYNLTFNIHSLSNPYTFSCANFIVMYISCS